MDTTQGLGLPQPKGRPTHIGPFLVESELGRGGMGVVYSVRHPQIDKPLALKLLSTGAQLDPSAIERFHREGEALARVRHPAVLAVHAAGEVQWGHYLVTDRIDGESLRDRMDRGPVAPDEVARIGRTLADALATAHATGVLHRDVKPHNVILRPDGQPVLLDFGLARSAEAKTLTQTGTLLGTPAYMSPEQADGMSPAKLDGRTDVYGLGATLFALLAARPPFEGREFALVVAVLQREPDWPTGVPSALKAIVQKAMSKQRINRYPDAAALREDLDAYLRGEAPRGTSAPRWSFVLGALGALIAVAALIVSARLALRDSPGPPQRTPLGIELEWPPKDEVLRKRRVKLRMRVTGDVEGAWVSVGEGERNHRSAGKAFDYPITLERGEHLVVIHAVDRRSEQEATLERTLTVRPEPAWFSLLPERDRPPLPLPENVSFGEDAGCYMAQPDGSILLWVPPGEFKMGSDKEGPVHTVRFERGFFIGRCEVTWGQYLRFCNARGRPAPAVPSEFEPPPDSHPVSFVNWNDAKEYCAWAKLRLPTEAEWEFAARGPEGWTYASGQTPPKTTDANLQSAADGFELTSPVGEFKWDRSPFGCRDMVGNVQEWTADWFAFDTYGRGKLRVDPSGPASGESGANKKMARGGSYISMPSQARAADRIERDPGHRAGNLGFRVARSVD